MHFIPLPWIGTGRAGTDRWLGGDRNWLGGSSCAASGGGCSDGNGMPGFCYPGGASAWATANAPQAPGGCPGSYKPEGIIACPIVSGGPG